MNDLFVRIRFLLPSPQRGGPQTGKAFLSLPGQPETDTAAPNRLDLISGPLHQIEKFVQISGAFRQRSINGKAQSVLIGKRPFSFFLPFSIIPILALSLQWTARFQGTACQRAAEGRSWSPKSFGISGCSQGWWSCNKCDNGCAACRYVW